MGMAVSRQSPENALKKKKKKKKKRRHNRRLETLSLLHSLSFSCFYDFFSPLFPRTIKKGRKKCCFLKRLSKQTSGEVLFTGRLSAILHSEHGAAGPRILEWCCYSPSIGAVKLSHRKESLEAEQNDLEQELRTLQCDLPEQLHQ